LTLALRTMTGGDDGALPTMSCHLRAQELGNRMQRPDAVADNLQAGEHWYGNQSTDDSPHPAEQDDHNEDGKRTNRHAPTNHKGYDTLLAGCHEDEIDGGDTRAWTRLSKVRMPARESKTTIANSPT
jgi:hypothetical protein